MTATAPVQAQTCDHLWHEDADDEGRTLKACVRKGGCGRRFVTGTTASRY